MSLGLRSCSDVPECLDWGLLLLSSQGNGRESHPVFLAWFLCGCGRCSCAVGFLAAKLGPFSMQFILNRKKPKRKRATLNALNSVESTEGLNFWLMSSVVWPNGHSSRRLYPGFKERTLKDPGKLCLHIKSSITTHSF